MTITHRSTRSMSDRAAALRSIHGGCDSHSSGGRRRGRRSRPRCRSPASPSRSDVRREASCSIAETSPAVGHPIVVLRETRSAGGGERRRRHWGMALRGARRSATVRPETDTVGGSAGLDAFLRWNGNHTPPSVTGTRQRRDPGGHSEDRAACRGRRGCSPPLNPGQRWRCDHTPR